MHLSLSKKYWKNHLTKKDNVIDATCGRGYDSVFLKKLIDGKLFLFDIQLEAIKSSKDILKKENICLKNLFFFHRSHADFSCIKNIPISLVVYNLGYLPHGDKTITTKSKTTLKSIRNACNLIIHQGAISITCYPGHKEGKTETAEIFLFLKSLNHKKYQIKIHHGQFEYSPIFIWIKKRNI